MMVCDHDTTYVQVMLIMQIVLCVHLVCVTNKQTNQSDTQQAWILASC
jgi:hypothetical protein